MNKKYLMLLLLLIILLSLLTTLKMVKVPNTTWKVKEMNVEQNADAKHFVSTENTKYDQEHQGEPEGEYYTTTHSGVLIHNISLVRHDMSEEQYLNFLSVIDNQDFGDEITIINNSLKKNDKIIQFLFSDRNNNIYKTSIFLLDDFSMKITPF